MIRYLSLFRNQEELAGKEKERKNKIDVLKKNKTEQEKHLFLI